MTKRFGSIIYIILMISMLCSCNQQNVENKELNDIDKQQQNEKEKEELLIKPLSEEQVKQQKKEKVEELTVQLEAAQNESFKLWDPGVGHIVDNKIVYDNKEEKTAAQKREESIKMQGYYRLSQVILQQIYSILDLAYDEKYIFDFKNKKDEQIDGNRPLNVMELAIYHPDIKVPFKIGDYHYVQATISNVSSVAVDNKDEPRNTILKRDISLYDNIELLYTNGKNSISLNIINVNNIFNLFTLSTYIEELDVDLIREDSVYTEYLKEPWKPDYKEYNLYKYVKYINDDCYDGYGLFNTDKTFYIAVTVGTGHIVQDPYKSLMIVPNNENTYDNLVKLMDELNLSEKADELIAELGLN